MPARDKEEINETESNMDETRKKENEEKKQNNGGNENGDSNSQKLGGSIKKRKRVKDEKGKPTKKKKQLNGEKEVNDDDSKTEPAEVEETNNTCKNEVSTAPDRVLTEQEEEEIVTWHEIVEQEQRSEAVENDSEGTENPRTPERAAIEYQEYRNTLQPPSIKQQRRDAIRKHKQNAQYPANFRGQQLFPPDFEQHASLQPSTQTRKYRQLSAQANNIKKDYFDDLP